MLIFFYVYCLVNPDNFDNKTDIFVSYFNGNIINRNVIFIVFTQYNDFATIFSLLIKYIMSLNL